MTQAFAAQYLGHRAGRWDLFLRPSLGHFDEQFARAPAPVLPRFDDVRDHLRAYLQRAVMGRAAAICQPRGSFTLVAPQPLVDRLARDAVRFRQRCDALAFLPLSNQFGSEFHWSVFLPWHRLLAWRAFQVDQIPPLRTVTHGLGGQWHPLRRSVPDPSARLKPCPDTKPPERRKPCVPVRSDSQEFISNGEFRHSCVARPWDRRPGFRVRRGFRLSNPGGMP